MYYATINLCDEDYKTTATLTASENSSDLPALIDNNAMYVPVATGEPDVVKLDGSYCYYPTEPDEYSIGWWSNQNSDVQGNFATPINIRITPAIYPNAISSVQIDFGDTLPSTFVVEYYNIGTSTTVTHNITPTESKTAYSFTEGNIAYVDFRFTKMQKPFTFLKIQEISFGKFLQLTDDNSNGCKIHTEIDILADNISIGTFDINALNENQEFNSLNPNGIYKYFKKGQVIEVATYEITDDANMNISNQGRFYLTSWEDSNSEMSSISAEDAVSLLDDMQYTNGLYYYGGIVEPSFMDCFIDLFEQAETNQYQFQSSLTMELATTKMYGLMPTGNCRDVLRDLLIMTQTSIKTLPDGTVYIYRPSFLGTAMYYDYYFDSEKITTNKRPKSTAVILPYKQSQTKLITIGASTPITANTEQTYEYILPEIDDTLDDNVYLIYDFQIFIPGDNKTIIYGSGDYQNYITSADLRTNKISFDFKYPKALYTMAIKFNCYKYMDNSNVYSIVSKNGTTTSKLKGTANATNIIDNLKSFFFYQCGRADMETYAGSIAKYWQTIKLNNTKRTAQIKTDNNAYVGDMVLRVEGNSNNPLTQLARALLPYLTVEKRRKGGKVVG